ncbi:Ca(2+)-dependent cysteine protease [Mortierella sp. GBA30]|nr:Ca(2+)-dependent cysteine protease [Mortierella sp. GBA30]
MSQEVGEPIVNVEKIVTILPDGRKVTKTIKKITHSYQVTVPAGTPVPEGAHLISTVPADAPLEAEYSNGHSSQPSQQSYNTQYSTETTASSIPSQEYQQLNNFSNGVNVQQGGTVVQSEPTVVVQSTVDADGRKVTKTTTTTSSSSSSSGSPSSFSKFFKRLSHLGKSSSDLKPLPTTPIAQNGQKQQQKHNEKPQPALPSSVSTPASVSVSVSASSGPESEVKKVQVQTVEIKKTEGTKAALSDCTGHRRALLIGINYTGLANPLHGCINDAAIMKNFLLDVGFHDESIRVLTDDQVGTPWMPTRDNILENLKWLIQDAKKNDSYFLHYSGHGGQVVDLDGDETNGMDNCIFPLDHKEKGVIIDDDLHNMLVKKLPPGVRLTVVFDCCHSGSALDLPYVYASTGYIRGSSALANLGHELVEGNFDAEALKELQEKWQKLQLEEKEFARQVKLKAADADVIMFSGCKDDQTSADVSVKRGGKMASSNGAMTYAFTKCIRENPVQSYQDMLNNIRDLLKEKYKQKPQLSSSRPMNMSELFHM